MSRDERRTEHNDKACQEPAFPPQRYRVRADKRGNRRVQYHGVVLVEDARNVAEDQTGNHRPDAPQG